MAFGRPDWLDLARGTYDFVTRQMMRDDRVGHSARLGRVTHPGFSSDAANMVTAALALHQATSEPAFLADAIRLVAALETHHLDRAQGFRFTADDAGDLALRPGGVDDDATPNPNAAMAANYVRLGLLTGEARFLDTAERLFTIFGGTAESDPLSCLGLLNAFDLANGVIEVVIIGEADTTGPLAAKVFAHADPDIVLTRLPVGGSAPPGSPAHRRAMLGNAATAYVCSQGVCSLPVTTPEALEALLMERRATNRH
jgi:uncharacterized protein YyaL (SSP411 family)